MRKVSLTNIKDFLYVYLQYNMGITGFAKFVEETFPEVVRQSTIRELDIGGRIAVDGFNECYTQMYVTRLNLLRRLSTDEIYHYIRDKNARNSLVQQIRKSWIMRILDFIMTDLRRRVVWVFDGDHVPQNKDETRAGRRERMDKMREEMVRVSEELLQDEFPNPIRYRKVFTDYMVNRPPTWEDYNVLSLILVRIGIPVVKAWGEGEKACARLCIPEFTSEDLLCKAVWSADVDSLLFGAPILLQRKRSPCVPGGMQEYNQDTSLVRVFESSKFTIPLDNLIKICVATGCDYLPKGIPGLGLKKSFKLFGQSGVETPFPEEHDHVLKLFQHTTEEVCTILTGDNIPRKTEEEDPLVRWFVNIYC
jgi:5'-3' exonuclease